MLAAPLGSIAATPMLVSRRVYALLEWMRLNRKAPTATIICARMLNYGDIIAGLSAASQYHAEFRLSN